MASYDYGKTEIVKFIKDTFKYKSSCLDVGACDGKWANLLNDYLIMDAVEIFKPNIIEWGLAARYRNVFNMDIADLEYKWYDLIIFGDVIEHMTVENARKVINYARGRCTNMIIGVPFQYPQDAIYGNPYERHIQDDLTEEIFNERYPGFTLLSKPRGNYAYFHLGDMNG